MNFLPMVKRLKVIDKNGLLVPLEPNWAQMELLDTIKLQSEQGRQMGVIVLKARQLGISTITQGVLFCMGQMIDYTRSMVIGNENDNAQHLLSMQDTFYENWPLKDLNPRKYNSRNEQAWTGTHSSIKTATAKTATVGRGKTLRALHASEVAFWDNARTLMLGLNQTIPNRPGTLKVLESTANGVGNYFYEMWKAAEADEIQLAPLFFPWHLHPEYTAEYEGLPYANLGRLDSEEQILRNMGISDSRLAWRRWCIRNNCNNDLNQFHQEYPTTPEEAFITTGTNVFPTKKLAACYEPIEGEKGRLHRDKDNRVKFIPDFTGPLTVYKKPSSNLEWGVYIIGGDPTHSTRGDYAVAQVLSRRTMEQVATLRIKCDPGTFATHLALLGEYYNFAVVAPEAEGPGYMTIGRLIEMNYPAIWASMERSADKTKGKSNDIMGWRTTARSKELAVGWLLKYVVDGDIILHDRKTYQEMRDYITLEGGGYGNAGESDHDDTVMSMAIALTAHVLEAPLAAYNPNAKTEEVPAWEKWGQQDA